MIVELLPIKEGEATENPPAQSPCTLCPERGPKKQLADVLFVEKREARKVGLHRASPWSTESSRKQPPLTGKEPRRKEWGKERKEWEKTEKKSGKQPKN